MPGTASNGKGEALDDGTCRCYDPALGLGPTCVEYSNSATCDDKGIATPDGGCFWQCDLIDRGEHGCDKFGWHTWGFDSMEDAELVEKNRYCGKCTGGCSKDRQCGPELLCMSRTDDDDYTDIQQRIPGCKIDGNELIRNRHAQEYGFCYNPSDTVVHSHSETYEEHCNRGAGTLRASCFLFSPPFFVFFNTHS